MLQNIYKLHFTTPVHFGSQDGGDILTGINLSFRADVLFSALYLQGEGADLYDAVVSGKLWFSDAFPYKGEELYLPKPIGHWNQATTAGDPSVRKQFKKLSWIPGSRCADFMRGVYTDPTNLRVSFGCEYEITRVNRRDFEDPLPYPVAVYRFADDAGLYIIVRAEAETVMADFEKRLISLSAEGIGGKVSSGWGKFTWTCEKAPAWLQQGLENANAPIQLLLSTALPADDALPAVLANGDYLVVRRGGFSRSNQERPHKKRTVFLLSSGSTFASRFAGRIIDVGQDMPHPVWRCAMAGFLGVTL